MNSEHEARFRSVSIADAGLIHLLVVYLAWGSTYLAIRVAVREGSGFPPFTMAGTRVLLAGIFILALASFTRAELKITGRDALILSVSGTLL